MFKKTDFIMVTLCLFTGLNAGIYAATPTLEIVSPKQDTLNVSKDTLNILGKAVGVSTVKINGTDAEVYSTTKLFAVDKLPLKPGLNTIEITAKNSDGTVTKKLEVTYTVPEPTAPKKNDAALAGIDTSSVTPTENMVLSQGDLIQVTFQGKPGLKAQLKTPSGKWLEMSEVSGENAALEGNKYQGAFAVDGGPYAASPIEIKASAADGTTSDLTAQSAGKVEVVDPNEVYMFRVKNNGEPLLFGQHEVRLGGPNLTELPAGTLLRSTGKIGNMYRVRLSPTKEAWVAANGVEDAPGEVPPHGYFSTTSVTPNDMGDTVSLSWKKQPYSVSQTVNGSGNAELQVDLYGAHDAATWQTHRSNLNVVKRMWTEQLDTETLRIHIELQTPIMWGYEVVTGENNLSIGIRKAPKLNANKPLSGLTIAVEAGHGGKSNIGARGVSGSEEQFVNMNTARELEKQLVERGAKVVQLRVDDENPGLSVRAQRATNAKADMMITIHANAGGGGTFFGAAGLSNYYKYGFCAPLATAIHKHILAETDFSDWGVVGNFNYGPIRTVTTMPSMLVEQAFMSNVEDEAKLLDPKVRAQIAKGIRLGMEEYLKDVAKQQKKDKANRE